MNIKLPSYDAITTALHDCHAPLDAAELHGLITGILTVSHTVKSSITGLHHVIPEPEALDEKIQNAIKVLEKLCALTALQLEDPSFDFYLLLPNDELPLSTRTEAVALWCQGFVSGLGEAGLTLPKQQPSDTSNLAETIGDLTAISQVDAAAVTDSEEEEVAYHELVEYVRLVAMTIYTDIPRDVSPIQPSKTIH